jgi:hypothetical protein
MIRSDCVDEAELEDAASEKVDVDPVEEIPGVVALADAIAVVVLCTAAESLFEGRQLSFDLELLLQYYSRHSEIILDIVEIKHISSSRAQIPDDDVVCSILQPSCHIHCKAN